MTVAIKAGLAFAAVTVACLVTLTTAPVLADDTSMLATSKARKLQVLAEGGSAWCKPLIRLRMVLGPDSPDLGNAASQVEIMNRLKTPIASDCAAARAAELTVIEGGKATGTYKAAAETGWTFAAAPLTVAALLPSPQPEPVDSSTAIPPLPRDIDYAAALIRFVKDNPALMQDESVLRCWANYRFGDEYSRNANQEFAIQPILQKARADLGETLAGNDGQSITTVIDARFGAYDFTAQQFPISLNISDDSLRFNRQCNVSSDVLPYTAIVKVTDINAIAGLPMTTSAAQAFADKRTRYGSVDRHITVAVTVNLDPAGFVKGSWGSMTGIGTLESATIFADREAKQPLYRFTAAALDKMRAAREAEAAVAAKAEADRQTEQRRQQLLAQREQAIHGLSLAPPSVKLANWISDGPVDDNIGLDNLRAVRAAALLGDQPVMAALLVQADGSGRSNVNTKWPGALQVSVAEGQPDLTSSGWYLVRGLLSVSEGETPSPARLTAQVVYACTQTDCRDAMDAAAIVDRKLAALKAAN